MRSGATRPASITFISGQAITAPQEFKMESSSQAKEPRDPLSIITVLLAAVIVVSASLIAYVVYDNSLGSSSDSEPVEAGDTVTLNYVGRFDSGWVFDTSLLDVAHDDALYPKSLTFTLRDNESYTTFDMEAGLYGESGGTIEGFAMGVIGLKAGDHRTIEISPGEGYPLDETMLENISIDDTIPATETMSESDFSTMFGTAAVELATVPHYMWTWDVTVTSIVSGTVTFKNMPSVGQTVYPYGDPTADDPAGWGVRVEAFDWAANDGQGEITIRNLLTEADINAVKGTAYDGTEFIVSGFDEANNTFQIHKSDSDAGYNAEIAGRTLFFEIWVVAVTPA
jgi:peptidylprolyl isomerase